MSDHTLAEIKKMMKKAKTALDTIDYSNIVICASKECPQKDSCYRYAITDHLFKHKIYGHTATLFYKPNEVCKCFIKLEK